MTPSPPAAPSSAQHQRRWPSPTAPILLATAIGITALALFPPLRLRARLALDIIAGRMPGVRSSELFHLVRPGAGFDLPALATTLNPAAALTLPPVALKRAPRGDTLFAARCASCHGASGEGGVAPQLVGAIRRRATTDWATFRIVRDGIAGTAMTPSGLSFDDAWAVIAHLRAADSGFRLQHEAVAPVGTDAREPGDVSWLHYSGNLEAHRHVTAPDVDRTSVGRLRLAWAFQLPPDPVLSQSVPVATRGMLIVTSAEEVVALSQQDGTVVWRSHHDVPDDLRLCCRRVNRGVAVADSLVLVGTLDARLRALDAATGRLVWEVQVASPMEDFSITSAPLVVEDRVLVGIAGGDFGARGFLDAYHVTTGRRLWRFHTIPAPGQPGSETWPADQRRIGGGTTWVPGAVDLTRRLVIWGTGNPSPNLAADIRPGDNLHTNSAIALDLDTGALRWTYQFTPGDAHDWDATQVPVLVDAAWDGAVRPLVLWANRNGFFYVLDRDTGRFLRATPFVRQTWNAGFDSAGRPRTRAASLPSRRGALVRPGMMGATSWWPPAYSPAHQRLFVATDEGASIFFRDEGLRDEYGRYTGGRVLPVAGQPPKAAVVALDIGTGQVAWRKEPPEPSRPGGGLLALGDSLVIGGQGRWLFALDARSGSRVWQLSLGAPIEGAPIAFRSHGHLHLAVTAGSMLFVFKAEEPPAPSRALPPQRSGQATAGP